MLRIGKLTDYATVILATLAADRSRLQNAGSLAERTHIAAPTVSKLLKQLHRAGLVVSTRGTHGGYQLARDPEAISAATILDALEGPTRAHRMLVGHRPLRHRAHLLRRPRLAAAECRHPPFAQRDLAGAARRHGQPDARDADRARAQTTDPPAEGAGMSYGTDRRAARQVVPARVRHRHRLGHPAAGAR